MWHTINLMSWLITVTGSVASAGVISHSVGWNVGATDICVLTAGMRYIINLDELK